MSTPKKTIRPDHWYARLFALAYDPFMRRFEERILLKHRKKLLAPLHGKILEIGAGTGVNFSLYAAGAEVWAIEPSASMLRLARKRLEENPPAAKIHLHLAGVGNPEMEELIQSSGFDTIVCTLVLCTIPDAGQAILDFKRWLKPGGRLVLIEHICGEHPHTRRWQNLLNPIWKKFGEGCNLNRQTDQLLRQHGFHPTLEYYFSKGLPFYVATGSFG